MCAMKGADRYSSPVPGSEMSNPGAYLTPYIIIMIAVLVIGTAGYTLIEGWSYSDSLYMTVITLATVGYREVAPLSDAGKYFTIFMIFIGVGGGISFLTAVTRLVVDHRFSWLYYGRKMRELINKMEGHTIFCGYGRFTQAAIQALGDNRPDIVVIDIDQNSLDEATEAGLVTIKGDASDEDILVAAGIDRASRVVSLLPKDSDNLYVILSCKELNPSLYIICRSEERAGEKRLKRAGADRIVSPYRAGGAKVAGGLMRPHVSEFFDLTVADNKGDLQIEEMVIPEGSPLAGKTLQESGLRKTTNIMVVAVVSEGEHMKFNPAGTYKIESGVTLICLGHRSDFIAVEKLIIDKTFS